MALAPFIYGGNTGIRTPQEAARLRAIAEALSGQRRAPHTIGEGLSAIGDAIAERRAVTSADRIESEGRAAYQSKYGDLLKTLLSGGGETAAPVPTADAPGGEVPPAPDLPPSYTTPAPFVMPAPSGDMAGESLARLGQDGGTPDAQAYAGPQGGMTAAENVASAMATGQPIQTAGLSIGSGPNMPNIEPRPVSTVPIQSDMPMSPPQVGTFQQPQPDTPQQPVPTQPGVQQVAASGFDPRMFDALNDPWAPEGTKAVLGALLEQRLKEMHPPPADPFTLSEGQVRYDPAGKEIARGPNKEQPDLPGGVREYQFAVSQGFPGTFQDWEASKKGGMSLQVDPATGAVSFQQGGNIKPLTEGQSKDTVYATRATGALPLLDKYGAALTNLSETVGGSVPLVGNYMKSPEYQQAEQAGREFLTALLRKDTGATIQPFEIAEYGGTYLPQPGDKPPVLEQKRIARIRALEGIKAGMPPQAILAMEKAGEKVDEASAPAPAPAPAPEASGVPEGVDPEVWQFMTPEERALWQ